MLKKVQRLVEIFLVAIKLGLTSFGGPVAHLGYFHEEYVRKHKWLDEESYTQLVALAQFLPGPASSQVGLGIGLIRGGFLGGLLAFIGFTFPSVVFLILFALAMEQFQITDTGWIYGLKLVAVAVVAHAILGMASKLTTTYLLKAVAVGSLIIALVWESVYTQVIILLVAGLIGYMFYKSTHFPTKFHFSISKRSGSISLLLFFVLLIGLPIARQFFSSEILVLVDSFYRAGAFVFGGGHVVLPLLEQEFVATGWIDEAAFLSGYGVTQAVPGPLFTFASYIGALIGGWSVGLLGTIAIFLPGFLLILGVLPFWHSLQQYSWASQAFAGMNAAVVGILMAAFCTPIWTSTISKPLDIVFAAFLFSLLQFWKVTPLFIVLLGIAIGFICY